MSAYGWDHDPKTRGTGYEELWNDDAYATVDYREDNAMVFRLYWLGPATEPGTWALDSGIGTPIWRIFGGWELEGLVSSKELPAGTPADHPRPRGWIEVYEENGMRFSAPQGEFKRSGIRQDSDDPIVQGYRKHGQPAY